MKNYLLTLFNIVTIMMFPISLLFMGYTMFFAENSLLFIGSLMFLMLSIYLRQTFVCYWKENIELKDASYTEKEKMNDILNTN